MAYNNIISNADAKVLQPEQEIVDSIVQGITQGSTILPLMRRLPDMVSGTATMNVLDTLPVTYWVDEGVSNGRKPQEQVGKARKSKPKKLRLLFQSKRMCTMTANMTFGVKLDHLSFKMLIDLLMKRFCLEQESQQNGEKVLFHQPFQQATRLQKQQATPLMA